MFDFLKWNAFKHDAPPGSLVYAGEAREFTPHASLLAYRQDGVQEKTAVQCDAISSVDGHINLVIVVGVHEADTIRSVGKAFDLPNLALEDVMHTGQRPKFAWVDDETGFVVMKIMDLVGDRLENQQVSLFWRKDLVIVFLEDENALLDGVISRIRKGKGRIRSLDGSYLMTAILDAVVDRQMLVLGKLSELAEKLESDLIEKTTGDLLGQLYQLKRETILLRNSLLPVREIFKALLLEDAEIPELVQPYVRDVSGHNEQTVEGAIALHDILKSMIDYQISLIGIRTNKVMQLLTIIATIFIPLTFIAGVYGMNFEYMPELHWRYGYFIALGVMGFVGILMLFYFARRKLL